MEFTTDFDGIYNGFGLLPAKTVEKSRCKNGRKITLFWFFDHFFQIPLCKLLPASKSRCKNWLCQNAETSVAAEPFEMADVAKIQKIEQKKTEFHQKKIISFLAKTLKHRWLPSQMHQGKLHKSLKKSCIVCFFNAFFSVPFRAKSSENAETSVAVDPNASSQRRRKEQNHRFLTKNHQSA